jgi:alpha,alpha-trehalase
MMAAATTSLPERADSGRNDDFRSGDEPLGQAEGAFLLCNHWLALAAWQAGEREKAIVYFERARAACGPPGLFCEEYDVEEHQLRGNLPQAFIHALLLECAGTLSPSSGA